MALCFTNVKTQVLIFVPSSATGAIRHQGFDVTICHEVVMIDSTCNQNNSEFYIHFLRKTNCGAGSAFYIDIFVKLLKRTLRTAETATTVETAAETITKKVKMD